MDREYNIPKIEIPLVIPSTEEDIKIRLNLLKLTKNESYELLKCALDNEQLETKNYKKIVKTNTITISDKLTLLALYSAEVKDSFGLFDDYFLTKDQVSNFIRRHELPFIRAKLAAFEILFKSQFKSNILSHLLATSDSYIRSDAFLSSLSFAREAKHHCDEYKYLNGIFKVLGTDSRGKKQKAQNFYMNRLYKNMVETGISLLRKSETDEITFRQTLERFHINVSELFLTHIHANKMSASELALEILTDSKIINSPSSYWDQTKLNDSSKLNTWIDCLFGHKVTKEVMIDPVIRSHQLWKPLESFYDIPHIWSQKAYLGSIPENYFVVFFKRHDEDATININC